MYVIVCGLLIALLMSTGSVIYNLCFIIDSSNSVFSLFLCLFRLLEKRVRSVARKIQFSVSSATMVDVKNVFTFSAQFW